MRELRAGATPRRWQQAFSPDEAATWEVNWIMEFERAILTHGTRSVEMNRPYSRDRGAFAGLLGAERLQIRRHRIHLIAMQPKRHAVHHGYVAHIALKRAQLLQKILRMLAG